MKSDHVLIDATTRRSFLGGLAAAAALPVLTQSSLAQAPVSSPSASREPSNSADSAEIDALMTIVSLRFGSYIKSDEVALVRRSIERQYASVTALRTVPIHNDDAPDFLFIPDAH